MTDKYIGTYLTMRFVCTQVIVEIRLVFMKVGEIDTLKEQVKIMIIIDKIVLKILLYVL